MEHHSITACPQLTPLLPPPPPPPPPQGPGFRCAAAAMLGTALQLSTACALVAHAIYQLRRLARTRAALASAQVRMSGSLALAVGRRCVCLHERTNA